MSNSLVSTLEGFAAEAGIPIEEALVSAVKPFVLAFWKRNAQLVKDLQAVGVYAETLLQLVPTELGGSLKLE